MNIAIVEIEPYGRCIDCGLAIYDVEGLDRHENFTGHAVEVLEGADHVND